MKKIFKRVLIITGIIIAVLVLVLGGFFLKRKSVTKDFAPMETGHCGYTDDYHTAVKK